jgi:glycerophosphoryl diester phosphodiesterase
VAPENTLPAFRAAIAEGADGVELDIRRTADQALVCLHDAGLGRTTSGRGAVRQHTLAEIRGLDAGGWFERNGHARHGARGHLGGRAGRAGGRSVKGAKGGKGRMSGRRGADASSGLDDFTGAGGIGDFTGARGLDDFTGAGGFDDLTAVRGPEDLGALGGMLGAGGATGMRGVRVPTLTEALNALPRRALVDVEVKFRGEGPDGAARVADLLGEVLAGRPDRDRILVSSFSRKLAAAAVPALGGIEVGLISSALVPVGRALRAAEECGCTLLAIQAAAFFGPKAKLAASRALDAGLQLLAWTVDDAETARRLADLGVGVIVSDRPGHLRRALDAGGSGATGSTGATPPTR